MAMRPWLYSGHSHVHSLVLYVENYTSEFHCGTPQEFWQTDVLVIFSKPAFYIPFAFVSLFRFPFLVKQLAVKSDCVHCVDYVHTQVYHYQSDSHTIQGMCVSHDTGDMSVSHDTGDECIP